MPREYVLSYKPNYKRRLPHIQPRGAILFVTFRLKDSIPQMLIDQWYLDKEEAIKTKREQFPDELFDEERDKVEKIFFRRFDEILERSSSKTWLAEPAIAQIVVDALHFRDGKQYELIAFCVMPNHVHLVIRPFDDGDNRPIPLSKIMQSLKRFTASEANKILDQAGQPFWQAESYDRFVRDQKELENIIQYVLNNPVKAGLVEDATDWPWSYQKN